MREKLVALVALAGCGAGGADSGNQTDAGSGCSAFITFDPDPANAIAGPIATERAIAHFTGVTGLPTYVWTVTMGTSAVTFSDAQADHSAIEFAIPTAGTYDVRLDVTSGSTSCPTAVEHLNVLAGTADQTYRLRVRAPTAPPQERLITIPIGTPTYAFGPYGLDRGKDRTGTVTAGAAKVPAYLRIAPAAAPDQIVEAFSDGNGAFGATLLEQAQTIVVIPATPGLAPRRFTSDFASPPRFDLDAGSAITGTVVGPTGAPLAGAHVQLAFDDVPSTLTTTAADGSFTVRAVSDPSATITVDVTPPATSGLPRLTVSGQTFDAAQPFAIAYDPGLVPSDIAGAQVTRGGTGVANAPVSVSHTIPMAGTVTSGGSGAVGASGRFRATAMTDATGHLPSLKLPPTGSLSVVVQVAAGDYAVATIDLSGGVPATIDAPPAVPIAFTIADLGDHPLDGVTVDAAPIDALALAGAVPIRVVSSATGGVSLGFSSGGYYDLRLRDPRSRAAAVTLPATTNGVPLVVKMPTATMVSGDIAVNGVGASAGALVQVLCASCTGIDRARPLAEVTTDAAGHYVFAIPDPQP